MTLVHSPAHSVSIPDRFEDDETGIGFDVFQDTGADDPRTWTPDEHAAIYVYNGPRGDKDAEVPENIVVQAFARFHEVLPSDDHAFAATVRWLNIYHPEHKVDIAMQTIRGYSQSDWQDVFVAVEEGYGTAQSHINEYRMWAYGDVWVVVPDEGDALSGIYADDAENAVKTYIAEAVPAASEEETVIETAPSEQLVPPTHSWENIKRWWVADGTVVADTGMRKPGVHFYPRREDDRLLSDPAGLADALKAASRVVDNHSGRISSANPDRKDR